jgi:ATP-dependent helicase/nuclease subunit A
MSKITIYQASAGSGKTYRLAYDYVKLLFINPRLYRHILAVTFTNKATGEMKSRIISELDKLGKKQYSGYRADLCRDLKLTESEVNEQANIILQYILHDYGSFSIWTIDSFFQRVIHNFTREIGLSSGFVIELNNDRVLQEAMAQLLLEAGTNRGLRQWLVDFSESLISEGKHWNFSSQVQKLGEQLFREQVQTFDRALFEKLKDDSFIRDYREQLINIEIRYENFLAGKGREACSIMEALTLNPDDFKQKKAGLGAYFRKLADGVFDDMNSHVRKGVDNPSEWSTANSQKKEEIEAAYRKGLGKILKEVYQYVEKNGVSYHTSAEILKNIYTLGILSVLSLKIRLLTEQRNLFLLSDAGKLLREVVGCNDAPFIYEKIGTRFNHFMIDEFQDTSHFQWLNFKPLISNSLSSGYQNLVVGDAKQSIYRWRNSDWKILGREIMDAFPAGSVEHISLDTNWRSRKNILWFNNLFFSKATTLLKEKFVEDREEDIQDGDPYLGLLDQAYTNIIQKQASRENSDGGYVRVTEVTGEGEEDWYATMMVQLPRWLEKLQEKGFRPEDTAILVRDHKDGRVVLDAVSAYLTEGKGKRNYTYTIISNEALLLSSAPAVNLLLSLFRYILRPGDQVNMAFLLHEYRRYLLKEEKAASHTLFTSLQNELNPFLPGAFGSQQKELSVLPVYDLAEHLIALFDLGKTNDLPYLQAFLDVILQFQEHNTSDLFSFLQWWEMGAAGKASVQLPDSQKAFRMMTIHKAKGLEFEAVMIPFCSWEFEPRAQGMILWCSPKTPPFNTLALVPVNFSKGLQKTEFAEDYWTERINTFIDNLNLTYVAFTRAKSALLVFIPPEGIVRRFHAGDVVRQSLPGTSESVQVDTLPVSVDGPERVLFETGRLQAGESKPFAGISEQSIRSTHVPSTNTFDRIRIRTHSLDYFEVTGKGKGERVKTGTIMHEIFERILVPRDVRPAVMRSVMEGKIAPPKAEEMIEKIEGLLTQETVRDWYSGEWHVKVEPEILMPGGITYRPDRVMFRNDRLIVIDYKFGEEESSMHKAQVRNYCQIMASMGLKTEKAWLWYVTLNKIVAVEV